MAIKLRAAVTDEHPNRDMRALRYAGGTIIERGAQHGHHYVTIAVDDVMRFRRTWERYDGARDVRIKSLDPAVRWRDL